ncbi:MAG TPA: hypothetical protein VK574_14415 [Terracidiphilus sp.]|jgi:hypothetical protein|nr:hypothetical protein [Terracidiphilus sp.]
MIQVTIYKSDGNKTFQNITSVSVENGILKFDWHPDPKSRGFMQITTTCPYYLEELFG